MRIAYGPRSAAAPLEDQLAGMTALYPTVMASKAFLDEGASGHRLQADTLPSGGSSGVTTASWFITR